MIRWTNDVKLSAISIVKPIIRLLSIDNLDVWTSPDSLFK